MTAILIVILVASIIYGVILFATARSSIWIPVGIHAAAMLTLFLCNYFAVGYSGGSDAMGNGMERGFLAIFYYCLMVVSSLVFLACLVWWYVRCRKPAG